MSKYEELDGLILNLLADRAMNWMDVHYKVESHPQVKSWRTTDARLQALRKAGLVKPIRRNKTAMWSLV